MKKKKLTITEADYLLANRRASRLPSKEMTALFFAVSEPLTQEALRVAKLIPEWDVYYKLGEIHKQIYTLPINFNEKNRAKYSPNRTK